MRREIKPHSLAEIGLRFVKTGVAGLCLLLLISTGCAGPGDEAAQAEEAAYAVVQKISGTAGFYTAGGLHLRDVPLGEHPHEGILSLDGRLLYVTDNGVLWMTNPGEGGNTISIVDVAAMERVGVIDLGDYRRPHGIDLDPASGRLVVTVENPDGLLLVDPQTREILRYYETQGAKPHMVLLGAGGMLAYVSNSDSGTLAALDLETGDLTLIPTDANPQGAALSHDGKLLYLTNNGGASISIIDTDSNERVGSIATGEGPNRIEITPDGSTLVYSMQQGQAVGFADVASRRQTAEIPLGGEAMSLTMSPDGTTVYSGVQANDKVFVISVAERRIVQVIETPPESGPDPAFDLR